MRHLLNVILITIFSVSLLTAAHPNRSKIRGITGSKIKGHEKRAKIASLLKDLPNKEFVQCLCEDVKGFDDHVLYIRYELRKRIIENSEVLVEVADFVHQASEEPGIILLEEGLINFNLLSAGTRVILHNNIHKIIESETHSSVSKHFAIKNLSTYPNKKNVDKVCSFLDVSDLEISKAATYALQSYAESASDSIDSKILCNRLITYVNSNRNRYKQLPGLLNVIGATKTKEAKTFIYSELKKTTDENYFVRCVASLGNSNSSDDLKQILLQLERINKNKYKRHTITLTNSFMSIKIKERSLELKELAKDKSSDGQLAYMIAIKISRDRRYKKDVIKYLYQDNIDKNLKIAVINTAKVILNNKELTDIFSDLIDKETDDEILKLLQTTY